MVFVWSTLTRGDPAYTVVQVATNDLIILFAFVPIVKFLLGVSNVSVPYSTLFLSVVLFVVIPLAAGVLTRAVVIRSRGSEYFGKSFVHKFDNATTAGLLLTLIIVFMKKVKISVLKTMLNKDLADEYGIENFTACPMMKEGQTFYADYAKPEGFCDEA